MVETIALTALKLSAEMIELIKEKSVMAEKTATIVRPSSAATTELISEKNVMEE